MTRALIIVDFQNDFTPGGALAVRDGDRIAARIDQLARSRGFGLVVATRDWHPADHSSFAEQGGPWPPHCVQGTEGAELHPSVAGLRIDRVQDVGTGPRDEGYSGFEGNDLAAYLRGRGVRRVLVTGIATDYCVRATALDAIEEGFDTTVFTDATVAIDVAPGDGRRALDEVCAAGGSLDRVSLLRDEAALAPLLDAKTARLREVAHEAGRGRIVIGLSGGIDSAVALGLAVRAL